MKKQLCIIFLFLLGACSSSSPEGSGSNNGNNNNPQTPPGPEVFQGFDFPDRTLASTHMGEYYCYLDFFSQKANCKGEGSKGQLGDGLATDSLLNAVEVTQPDEVEYFVDIHVGFEHVCALSKMGQIYCWGDASNGKLGRDTNENAYVPTMIDVPEGTEYFRDLMVGYSHACAIDDQNRTFCWGEGEYGQMGNGTTEVSNPSLQLVEAPLSFEEGEYINDVAKGQGFFTCALTNLNNVYCWGINSNNEFSNNAELYFDTPEQVNYPSDDDYFESITSGLRHTCGTTIQSRYYCWGSNSYAQLGTDVNNTATHIHESDLLYVPDYVTKLVPGHNRFCALSTGDNLFCNIYTGISGALGDAYNREEIEVDAFNDTLVDFQPGIPNVGVNELHLIIDTIEIIDED